MWIPIDRADDDDVVVQVAHYLQLIFLPPEDGDLDQDLVDRTQLDAAGHDTVEFLAIVGHATA